MSEEQRLGEVSIDAIPKDAPDVIEWAQQNVVLPASARAKYFNASITPWLVEPMRSAVDAKTRVIDLVKPVQSGGSTVGEVVILFWITFWRGMLQYNWTNDERGRERWASRVKAILEACKPVSKRLSEMTYKAGEIDFGNVFFKMQGSFVESNLDSDSIRLQINEEVHQWEPGHLGKAENRSTAIWDFKRMNISNAGVKGDQLHQSFNSGTMEFWEVKCPGCGLYHRPRTYFDYRRPDLGGIVYDAAASSLRGTVIKGQGKVQEGIDEIERVVGFYEYNYNKLRPTIHLQMPCGFKVHNEDVRTRRQLSMSGRYCEPTNIGAEVSHRSFNYESASVDFIDMMMLIKQKHSALRARKLGDPEPFRIYKQERECLFYDAEDVPIVNVVSLSKDLKKNRAGLPAPRLRAFSLDRQQGEKARGEFPHWWLVIRDYKVFFGQLRSILVWEGKLDTDEEVIAILKEHECEMHQGVADSGDDTDYVYNFCYRHGINAIKGTAERWYVHENGARRNYSPERPLHSMLNYPPKHDYVPARISGGVEELEPDDREPMFWLYSKGGIRERLNWLRNNMRYETPSDVSDDYKNHNDAEERVTRQHPRTGEDIVEWVQRKRRNDLFVCECYCAMMLDMSGALGEVEARDVKTSNESN